MSIVVASRQRASDKMKTQFKFIIENYCQFFPHQTHDISLNLSLSSFPQRSWCWDLMGLYLFLRYAVSSERYLFTLLCRRRRTRASKRYKKLCLSECEWENYRRLQHFFSFLCLLLLLLSCWPFTSLLQPTDSLPRNHIIVKLNDYDLIFHHLSSSVDVEESPIIMMRNTNSREELRGPGKNTHKNKMLEKEPEQKEKKFINLQMPNER